MLATSKQNVACVKMSLSAYRLCGYMHLCMLWFKFVFGLNVCCTYFFFQPDQSAIRRMLHASGVNKKTLKSKQKIEKAMSAFKVRIYIQSNFH